MRHRLLLYLKRRWLLWLLIIGALVLAIANRFEIELFLATARQGQWQWIAAAIGLQVAYYVVYAVLYHLAFITVGVRGRLLELFPVLFASVFVNSLAPSAGLGGAVLFIDDAARRGQSAARATDGVLLVWVAENLAVLPVLAIGLGDLISRGVLQAYQAFGAVIYLFFIAAVSGMLFAGRLYPEGLRRFLAWLQENINWLAGRFLHRELLFADWAAANAQELITGANAIANHPRQVGRVLAAALGLQLINIASLYAIFVAFGTVVGVGTVVAGLAIGLVYAVISILPYDAGIMQLVMVLVYDSLGVPVAKSVVIVLVFGGLNVWLPLLIGFFFLRQVRTFGGGRR